MNERDKLIEKLIREKGGTRDQYLHLLDGIAYHESAGTLDPSLKQFGGGPGRGKYQFEVGRHAGGITAANRTKNYYKKIGEPVPKWLEQATKSTDLDVSSLTPEQQDVLFLGNMRNHPKADLAKYVQGEESIQDFWANYHWAGPDRDRKQRIKSFNESYSQFENKGMAGIEAQKKNSIQSRPNVAVDNTAVTSNIRQQLPTSNQQPSDNTTEYGMANMGQGIDDLVNYVKQATSKKAMGGAVNSMGMYNGGSLNEYNAGGTHEQNSLGGIPQGMGANGKMNTVEQGESSFKFDDGKYIFSDRVHTDGKISSTNKTVGAYADGGSMGKCGGPGQPPCRPTVDEKGIKGVNDYIKQLDKEIGPVKPSKDGDKHNYTILDENLYNNLPQYEYSNNTGAMLKAAKSMLFSTQSYNKDIMKDYGPNSGFGADLFKKALGYQGNLKHLKDSKYSPTKSKDNNKNYSSIKNLDKEDFLQFSINELGDKKSKVTNRQPTSGHGLGNYTISKGEDEKGRYVSYYDKYDFGNSLANKFLDETPEVYDRIYYKDNPLFKEFKKSVKERDSIWDLDHSEERTKGLEKIRKKRDSLSQTAWDRGIRTRDSLMVDEFAEGGTMGECGGPGQPPCKKSLSDETTYSRNKIIRDWAHRYALENNPEKLKGESDEQYAIRNKMFFNKIKELEEKSPLHREWNKVSDGIQKIEDPWLKMGAEIVASPVELASLLSKKGNSNNNNQFKSNKYSRKESIDTVDAGLDALLLGMPIKTAYKPLKEVTRQVALKLPYEIAGEIAADKASLLNEKAEGGNLNTPDPVLDIQKLKEPISIDPKKQNKIKAGPGPEGSEVAKIPNLKEFTPENRKAWEERYGSDTQYFNKDLDIVSPTGDRTIREIIESRAKEHNISPNFLYSTMMAEGLDDTLTWSKQDMKSQGEFPIKGAGDVGLDTMGAVKEKLFKKGYLNREEFEKNTEQDIFVNEKGEGTRPSNFRDLDYATSAVGAFIRNSNEELDEWVKANDVELSPIQRKFFENVAYNAGQGNARKMIESYKKKGYLKDDKFTVERPDAYWKDVHKYATRRLGSMVGLDEQGILKFNEDMSRKKIQPTPTITKGIKK